MTALTNAEYLLGSVALRIDEYYMGVGEAPGVWMGHWSPVLGVQGVVEADALRALIDGNDPTTGAPFTNHALSRATATDCTERHLAPGTPA